MDPNSLLLSMQTTGSYRTPDDLRPWIFDRLFGWSDLWFYLRQTVIIWSGSRAVRRGVFGHKGWIGRAHKIFELIENCGGKIEITGMEHVVGLQRPVVFAANHMSMMETMLLPGGILLPSTPVTTVVKESLLHYPIFGRIMRHLDPITVTRRNPREDLKQVLDKGTAALQSGLSVVLFPQSTRTHWFAPADFNSIAVKLARKANVPVVPVALRTDFQDIGRGPFRDMGPLHRSRPIRFAFGPPLPPGGHPKEIHEKVVKFIANRLESWGVEVRDTKGARHGATEDSTDDSAA
jgi:1-acyl-sn-glycerol-3-phosphate acyltransferase